jgi:hypothetical protein
MKTLPLNVKQLLVLLPKVLLMNLLLHMLLPSKLQSMMIMPPKCPPMRKYLPMMNTPLSTLKRSSLKPQLKSQFTMTSMRMLLFPDMLLKKPLLLLLMIATFLLPKKLAAVDVTDSEEEDKELVAEEDANKEDLAEEEDVKGARDKTREGHPANKDAGASGVKFSPFIYPRS